MRFRRIEKDTLGTGTEFIQNDKKTMANSKTYIPKPRSKKVAMNKIKNTKVGDDIHYYINGMEGRGIVVKMANEYLEIFKENGQLGTIHINDTFFVKDILINKQWDDMEDSERYDALMKIHAPSPRYITKQWHDMPEEIKVLLQKQMSGGTGSTFEQGESKDSETQDHARTGFAQNEQYSSKKPKGCKCGDPKCKDPKCKKPADVKKSNPKTNQNESEGDYNKIFNSDGTRKQTRAGEEKEILGHYTSQSGTKGGKWAAEQEKKRAEEMAKKKKEEVEAKKKEPVKAKPKTDDRIDPDNPNYTMSGKRITSWDKKYGKYAKKALYVEWLEKFTPQKKVRMIGEQTEMEFSKSRRGGGPENLTNRYYRDGTLFEGKGEGSGERAYAKRYPQSNTGKRLADAAKPKGERRAAPKKAKGKFSEVENEAKESEKKGDGKTGGFVLSEDDYKDAANKALYKQWLEKKGKRPSPRTQHGFGTTQSAEGQEAQSNFSDATASAAGAIGGLFSGGEPKTASEGDAVRANIKTRGNLQDQYDSEDIKVHKAKKVENGNSNLFEAFSEDDEEYKHLSEAGKKKYHADEAKWRKENPDTEEVEKSRAFGKLKPVYEGDTQEAKATKKAYEVWLERQELNKGPQLRYEDSLEDSGLTHEERRKRKKKPAKKSDVEHGVYGNAGGAPEVGVSTDTKVDMSADSGYEERPHISVEEAGKLPRSTFNPHGSNELSVSGGDSKDSPKFSQPSNQEQPVRKAGLPQQHPNTYGVRYGMKGGVKKVWCPEHQMWEETRKDWHEE